MRDRLAAAIDQPLHRTEVCLHHDRNLIVLVELFVAKPPSRVVITAGREFRLHRLSDDCVRISHGLGGPQKGCLK
jgi:hypothetical protein